MVTSNPASLPVVYIASTDASLRNSYTHIPGIFQLRDWSVLEDDVFDGAEDERTVGFLVDQLGIRAEDLECSQP